MKTITMKKNDLEILIENTVHKAVKETLQEIIVNKKTRNSFLELLEDWALGQLIEEGRKNDFVDKKEFMNFLDQKIANLS